MRVAVMGSGGTGGYYGGLLALNGNDVTFLARGAHLAALREKGLKVKSPHGDFAIQPAQATDNAQQVGQVDWVLFTVKTYDTAAAMDAMRPLVGAATTIVTMQNGVESYDQLAAAFGKEKVIVAPTQITSAIVEPGVIVQDSAFRKMTIGELDGGVTLRVEWLVEQFKRHNVDASASDEMPTPLWMKWIFLAPVAGLTALARTEGAVYSSGNWRGRRCARRWKNAARWHALPGSSFQGMRRSDNLTLRWDSSPAILLPCTAIC